jgi:anhydro-N-acetylmuramic acid kinase
MTLLYIGIMSGTSLDGIDIVIADLSDFPSVIAFRSYPFPPALYESIVELASDEVVSIEQLGRTHLALGQIYAKYTLDALTRSGIEADAIRAIGLHGQTIRHLPQRKQLTNELEPIGMTMQIGSGAVTAALTGIDVVSDFRTADIAAGGEGAPLVPMFDNAFLRSDTAHRVILNIGGIANITSLPNRGEVTAFDTGPGNMVIDALMQRYYDKPFDDHGAIAAKGTVSSALFEELVQHPFFQRRAPKSTGREEFGAEFCESVITKALSLSVENADTVATVTELTARSIADAVKTVSSGSKVEIIASGGGTKNSTLMKRIAHYLPDAAILTSDDVGIPSQAKESLAFAWFAKMFIEDRLIHLPHTTGADSRQILGVLAKGKK